MAGQRQRIGSWPESSGDRRRIDATLALAVRHFSEVRALQPLATRLSTRPHGSSSAALTCGFLFLAGVGGLLGACVHQTEPPPVVAASSSSTHVQEALTLLGRALDQLAQRARAGAQSGEASSAALEVKLRAAHKDVLWLERRAPAWPKSAARDEFLAAISAHVQLLGEVSHAPSAEAEPLLDAVVRDLQVKSRQCRRFGGPVPVSVNVVTRDAGDREVTGYEVWYVRKAYEHKPAAFRRFERNSSPAHRVFQEAGYYVLWAARPAVREQARQGDRLDVEVGPDQLEQVVDLRVPLVPVEPFPAPREAALITP